MADALIPPATEAPSRRFLREGVQWLSLAQAAAHLDLSPSSLRRRLRHAHWIEGRHYRWFKKGLRSAIQINLQEAERLIRLKGW